MSFTPDVPVGRTKTKFRLNYGHKLPHSLVEELYKGQSEEIAALNEGKNLRRTVTRKTRTSFLKRVPLVDVKDPQTSV